MQNRTPLLVFVLLIALGGCTPMGEGIAKRDASSPTFRVSFPESLSPSNQESVAPLDAATRSTVERYGPSIRKAAEEYGLDWRLILAVMKQESKFDAEAESHAGASGLMQVMPVTQREIAERLDLADSSHPEANIRMGAYYLRKLVDMFDVASGPDRLRLALASYNAGPGRVYDAQELAAYLGDNPARWQSVKDALPLLSRRYDSLHRHVWIDGRPRSGSFGGSRQTIAYVDSVMSHYEAYQQTMN